MKDTQLDFGWGRSNTGSGRTSLESIVARLKMVHESNYSHIGIMSKQMMHPVYFLGTATASASARLRA